MFHRSCPKCGAQVGAFGEASGPVYCPRCLRRNDERVELVRDFLFSEHYRRLSHRPRTPTAGAR